MLASPTVGSELSDLHTRRHRHTHTLCQGGNAPLQISAHLAQHTTPTAQQSLPCRKHLVRKRRRNCTAKCTHSHTFTHTYTVGTYSPYCSATLNHTHTAYPITHAKDIHCTRIPFLTPSVSVGDKQPYTHTGPLTAEVVIEPRYQVEGCILFRGGFAPCSSCHLVPQTTP